MYTIIRTYYVHVHVYVQQAVHVHICAAHALDARALRYGWAQRRLAVWPLRAYRMHMRIDLYVC